MGGGRRGGPDHDHDSDLARNHDHDSDLARNHDHDKFPNHDKKSR